MDDIFLNGPKYNRGLVASCGDSKFMRRTWAELQELARHLSGTLADAGVEPGDTVAVLATNPSDVAAVIQAVWMRRASVAMLHQPTPRADLAVWAKDTQIVGSMLGAKLLILESPFEAAEQSLGGFAPATIVNLRPSRELTPLSADEEDIALLQLTSGSTGTPKAVAVTHANIYQSTKAIEEICKMDAARDVTVSWLPLFHDLGMIGSLITPMQIGSEAICATPLDFIKSPLIWPELITQHRGTMTAGPNFAYSILAKHLIDAPDGAYDLSRLRCAFISSEPVDPETVYLFNSAGARFGLNNNSIAPTYGMAEATLGISCAKIGTGMSVDTIDRQMLESRRLAIQSDKADARSFVRLGQCLPGIEARIVDDVGSPQETIRTIGEIQIRGDAVTSTYFTSEGPMSAVDADGWLNTGDVGYFTESGEVVICGRRKDTAIIAGRNILLTDIERAAGQVSGVRQGNAVAVRIVDGPHRREGFAVVVESKLHQVTAETDRIRKEIKEAIFSAVEIYPKRVIVVEPGKLPKTPSGKLRRTDAASLVDL
ncbi:fatty acyl-AMP ligase [Mycobacterium sp. 852002-40037_SCH5390672]|uniref:fatty acyl-AMP ligase n=1 Tax=Mycobacterium sp. 852002-40037_SCH5390672 TaxID=1834089 RepID=UPI0035171D46